MADTNTATKKPKATAKPAATPNPTATPDVSERPEKVEMSTDVFSKEVLTELKKREKQIKTCIGKIDSSFETIAFNLHWINAKEAYRTDGFDNIAKYCEDRFGYEKSTCYSFISIAERFAKKGENGAILEEFDPRYKGYSSSKLSVMVGLTDEQIEHLTPDMSVRAIKAYVESLKEISDHSEENGEGEDSNTKSNKSKNKSVDKVVDSTAVVRNTLITYKGLEDYYNNVNFDKISDFINRALRAHPNATIEVSYTLPDSGKGA